MVKVLRCDCKHDFQDKKYGKGLRVHNKTQKPGWRCSVCENNRGE